MRPDQFIRVARLGAYVAGFLMLALPGWSAENKRVGMALWTGCEDVCAGVRDYLTQSDPSIELVIFDAARDMATLDEIPDKAIAAELDLMLTWGTRVTRSVAGTVAEFGTGSRLGDIPVVFTVVADPVGADIIQSYEDTGRMNITGVRNRVPEMVNISGLRRVLPGFQHLGLLYEAEAENSRLKFEELSALAQQMNFTLSAVPLAGSEEIMLAQMRTGLTRMAEQGVQFIYLGSSTFLEVHADMFTKSAVEVGLPVLSPYENLVRDSNAYMSIAARDYSVGLLAGQQAMDVLTSDVSAGEFPVAAMEEFAFVLNARIAETLKLFPPIEVLQVFEIADD
jgi:ABC-type uncharacterized transport system substrate-binding protein